MTLTVFTAVPYPTTLWHSSLGGRGGSGRRRCAPLARATFGTNLRRARQATGLSQEALADAADLHRNTIPALENDQAEPRLGTILKLARALGVEPSGLLKGL